MSLSSHFLDELRARTVLSTLVGKTTKLQKAGHEWRACCPFHNEKSPSFYVNDDKGFYHCFGCSAHGDAIAWMTEQRGLPFMDAVRDLAQAGGLEMPPMEPRAAEKAEAAKGLHEACADAATWFTEQLNGLSGANARDVLAKRGITPETAREFGLGFAPDSRGGLKGALERYGDPMLVEAGLLISVEEKAPYDRFRGRLMIPIRDPRGRTVAFGARIIGDGEPKYLNSPETPLFDKGRTLYNLDKAAPATRKTGRVLVVEGYMDVIALAQAGFREAVAPLGTALTEAQLGQLWRLSSVPILCFDGDSAGQKAALRAAHRAIPMLTADRSLAFVTLPPGVDPDDLVHSKGPAALDALLATPQPLVDRIWASELAAEPLSTPEQRAGLKQRLTNIANGIADQTVRAEYHAEFRRRLYKLGTPAPVVLRRPVAKLVGPAAPPRPDAFIVNAIVDGLARWPALAETYLEEVTMLRRFATDPVRLDAIIDAAFSGASRGGVLPVIASASTIFPTETDVAEAIVAIIADAPRWGISPTLTMQTWG